MKTATLLGHKDPGVVHNHYKALVPRPTALRFWGLSPEGDIHTGREWFVVA